MFRTIVTAAILTLGVTAAAQADTAAISVKVGYGDLNLTRPQDDKILADRIRDAAHAVCLRTLESDAYIPTEMQECERSTTRQALSSIEGQVFENVRVHLSKN